MFKVWLVFNDNFISKLQLVERIFGQHRKLARCGLLLQSQQQGLSVSLSVWHDPSSSFLACTTRTA